jgi:hypothetical protein
MRSYWPRSLELLYSYSSSCSSTNRLGTAISEETREKESENGLPVADRSIAKAQRAELKRSRSLDYFINRLFLPKSYIGY